MNICMGMDKKVASKTGISDAMRKSRSESRVKNLLRLGSKGPSVGGFHWEGERDSSVGLGRKGPI